MKLSFIKICIIIVFIVLNCQVLTVVFGETTLSENKNLTHHEEHLKDLNVSKYNSKKLKSSKSNNEEMENSPWFLNIPLLPVIVATSNSIPEGSCKRQLRLYFNHLKNGTLWATEMFDSSAKYPYGVFDGFTRHLGSFDQCERIETKIINNEDGKIEEIRSRYCLVDVKFKEKNEPSNFTEEYNLFFDSQDSAWEAIREKGDFRRFKRYFLQMALCFPAKCQTEDIVTALKEPLDEFSTKYNIKVEASILPMYCSSLASNQDAFSNYEIIFSLTFLLIFTIIVISTIIDINSDEKNEPSLLKNLLFCFSARKNWNNIFKINYVHPALDSIHSIRVILTGLAVIAHRQIQYLYSGTMNGRYFEWISSDPIFGLLHNFGIVVDGFFGLGGLLLSYALLETLNKTRKLDYVHLILNRVMRLLPLYIFVTFGYATIFHRFGSGPFWEVAVGLNRDSCSSHWWSNLFFINNYFSGDNKCVIQSWYLAVDFHCFLIGLLLITAFNKMSRKIGYIFLCCTLIFSAALTFYFTYNNDADPILISYVTFRIAEEMDYFLNYYVKSHLRLAAYITGLIFGALLYDCKKTRWRISKMWSQIFYLSATFLAYTLTWSGTLFMNPNLKINAFLKALYASLHRPIFSFCICAIPLLFSIGDGLEFYYKIINIKWLQPISRITFSIYLTHYAIFLYELGTTKTSFTFTFYNGVKYIVGDFIFSVLLGLFFAILIEFPFRNFGSLILKRSSKIIKKEE
ncbi:O-acyltransferase like protein-like [Leptopilina boulardi]|uniref:O-acyltransferase like protein-like n=1 Tax=Leptopilina boulardi TaxID=63433 RepID=UPI0021F68CE5|nr:O-acyltransferase like protein-like [Leptopilina boulardi]